MPTALDASYWVRDSSEILSPGMVLFLPILRENLAQLLAMAGGQPSRLRPHCKTHKMPQVIDLELQSGINKHKCATIAEAEMLAQQGVRDIFLAYNLVGPNIERAVAFRRRFPQVKFAATVDHPLPLQQLATAMVDAGTTIDLLLDVDTGLHRTGCELDDQALALYHQMAHTDGIVAGGLHVYDGQNHQTDFAERMAAVQHIWQQVVEFRARLLAAHCPVPKIVAGGTGSFPCFAQLDDVDLELSPGTSLLHDAGYRDEFPDLAFRPAALMLTRVVSLPKGGRVTCDLGYKSVAADPPAGRRVEFPTLPDARVVLQNEEHLVLETSQADSFQPGDLLWAIPRHICPTSALHKEVTVVEQGVVVDRWPVVARDRQLTI